MRAAVEKLVRAVEAIGTAAGPIEAGMRAHPRNIVINKISYSYSDWSLVRLNSKSVLVKPSHTHLGGVSSSSGARKADTREAALRETPQPSKSKIVSEESVSLVNSRQTKNYTSNRFSKFNLDLRKSCLEGGLAVGKREQIARANAKRSRVSSPLVSLSRAASAHGNGESKGNERGGEKGVDGAELPPRVREEGQEVIEDKVVKRADFTTKHFNVRGKFADFNAMEEDYDWRNLILKHEDAEYDKGTLMRVERAFARGESPFARELRKLLDARGGEPIMRSTWKLPKLLATVAEDLDQPMGAWVYVTIARGVELIPDGVNVVPTHLPNYKSAEQDYKEKVHKDVDRQLALRFVGKWKEVAKECGVSDDMPTIILPIGAVDRKEKIRIVFDPSRELEGSSEGNGLSLNDLQVVPGDTCLASIQLLLAAMSDTGSFWKADLSAAFSQIPLAAKSVTYCGFMWQGPYDKEPQVYAYRRLGFGFRIGCFVQQCVAIMLTRALMRGVSKLGLKCGRMPEYNKPQPKNYPVERQHERKNFQAKGRRRSRAKGERVKRVGTPELTTVLSYLDDFGGCANEGNHHKSTRAGDFSFLHFLSLARHVGCVIAPEEGKTDRPTRFAQIYLGFEVVCKELCVRLDAERIKSMVALMDGLMSRATISVKELQSLIGLLVFAAVVIPGARFAYSGLLDKVRSLKGRAPKSHLLAVDKVFKDDCEMYKTLMHRMNGLGVVQGARRPCVRWEAYSDASFLGWCYWAEAGHYKDAEWPRPWLKSRIGLLTKFKDIFICELEAWGVLFMCRDLMCLCAHGLLHIHCDNAPVVAMLRRHTARSSRCAPIIREIEFLSALYDCELCVHHVRTYDNTLADLGTRQFEKGFNIKKLVHAKQSMRAKAKARFGTKPRRCEHARPDIFDLYQKYRASMDVWSAPLSCVEQRELEELLPHYLKSEGESALTTTAPN